MVKFSQKIPSRQESIPVLSVIVFIVFSWTIYRMVWYVPSWLEHLSIWSVATTAAYVLSFALLESMFIFILLWLFSLFFPRRIFKQQFIAQACSIVVVLSVGAFLLQRKMKLIYRLTYTELLVYPAVILVFLVILVLILAYVFKRFESVTRFIRLLAERMTVFLYVYLPLGLLGWLVVIFRNIV